ncbi:hypothetical protein [Streptomyces sp. NPDC001380]|uniref:hypothetical protein n=1 Tax=Streptomyces sp. NPDC001380 TaxID=3364566 RepID=UPI0036A630E8
MWPVALAVVAVLAVGGGTALAVRGGDGPATAGAGRSPGATATAPATVVPGAPGKAGPSGSATPSGEGKAPLRPGKGGPTEVRPPDWPEGSAPPDRAGGPAPRSWTADGNRLSVWFWAGVCQKFALRADESRDGVVAVRVVVAEPAPPGQVCPMIAKYQRVEAVLQRPVGDRSVVDAATGRPLPHGSALPVLPRPGVRTPTEKGPQ